MEYSDDKELSLYLIRKQKDCEFSLRTFLVKDNDLWKNCFSMLKLVKKGSRKPVKLDYGKYIFEEQNLDIVKGINILSELYSMKGKSRLIIPKYGSFEVTYSQLNFIPSKYKYAYFGGSKWPSRLQILRMPDRTDTNHGYKLLKKGIPYYPSIREAILHLFKLDHEDFTSFGDVYIIIPDYRARIDSIKIMFSKVEIMIDAQEIEYNDLLLKAFIQSETNIKTYQDIALSNKLVEINFDFNPDTLSVILFSHKDNFIIDEKGFTKWRREREGVLFERPEEEIRSLMRAGESQTLEYKYNVESPNSKNEFIESIISFLNTNKGIILIGVDDKGNIVETSKSAEDIQKMIHDSCDPPPANIKIDKKEIDDKTLLIVEVPEGDNKPYQSKRDKQFYIRHNANDMIMERSELLEILQKKSSTYTFH